MRKTIATATFVALGATTAGVGAIDSIPAMKGSDTLKNLTRAVISGCTGPNGNIVSTGTGSGNGQTALIDSAQLTVDNTALTVEAPGQTIAPMSRGLNNGGSLCTVAAPDLPETEGLVVALDGLSIIAADAAVTATCNA